MLNTTVNSFKIGGNTTKVSFNTPSIGMIQKSHPKSKFIKFHFTSKMAERLLDSIEETHVLKSVTKFHDIDRHYGSYEEQTKIPVTVLQLMVFGQDNFLAEIVYNNDLIEEEEKEPYFPPAQDTTKDNLRH
jgi:hypothetical protein